MIKKLLSVVLPKDPAVTQADAYRQAVREEARIGGTVFGPVPEGVRREFFCLDEHTWVWHEEWTDANNMRHARTTRYDVRPNGILKAQDGQPYQPLGREEAQRLLQAAQRYNQLVDQHMATRLQTA